MRRHDLDNIRWITIVLVVIFHIFFYYNNIGIAPMFAGAEEFQGDITFGGLYQYIVYPWFMVLLFIVSGISARLTLQRKGEKEFFRGRKDKILAPSTLGVLAFGWIGGYVIYLHNAKPAMPEGTPGFVGVIISLLSGIGALWFLHVLFVAVLILLLMRKITKKTGGSDETVCGKIAEFVKKPAGFLVTLVFMYLVLWGGSHILNMPLVTSYRNGIYVPAFLMGYYVFSVEEFMDKLKKMVILFGIGAVISGVLYIIRNYGTAYGDVELLSHWDVNLYMLFMVLFIFGGAALLLNRTNGFFTYMKNTCFGIYVFHIPVLLVTNFLLEGSGLPMAAVYGIELVSAFIFSILLYGIVRRIPILRYWILGIRRPGDTKK